jgi:autotransporter strand-loop-strand O-heptosyltransferase
VPNKKKWKTKLYLGPLTFEHDFNLEDSRVFIVFESSSLGDTIAWMPYCEEFRKKHNCHVIVSSFRNDMFEKLYPEIEFVERGVVVNNIKALYRLGWFYDEDKEPVLPSTIPLQKSAANILGLDYGEMHSVIHFEPKERPYAEKYICIAPSSTAGCKLWNNPTGWQDVTDYLLGKGYEVRVLSKEEDGYMGNNYPKGATKQPEGSLKDIMKTLQESELFIGISSGLSWVAWGCEIPTIMISGFSDDYTEPRIGVNRIINKNVCNSCWNRHDFDAGDWNWCPDHKNTDRQFECSKNITSQEVINEIDKLLF